MKEFAEEETRLLNGRAMIIKAIDEEGDQVVENLRKMSKAAVKNGVIMEKDVELFIGFMFFLSLHNLIGNATETKYLFYLFCQSDIFQHKYFKIAETFLSSEVSKVCVDYWYLKNNVEEDRTNRFTIDKYLKNKNGFTEDMEYNDYLNYGGKKIDIYEQQRGLILNEVENSIKNNFNNKAEVFEIGTSTGDILNHLSLKFKESNFVGIDFDTSFAKENYSNDNIKFLDGYAINYLLDVGVNCDILFTSNTFICLLPNELDSYLNAIRKSNIKEVIICEPSWGFVLQEQNDKVISLHLEKECWFHNYHGYFLKHGFDIKYYEKKFQFQKFSQRGDIYTVIIRAENKK